MSCHARSIARLARYGNRGFLWKTLQYLGNSQCVRSDRGLKGSVCVLGVGRIERWPLVFNAGVA
jgi:hypothetical protein